MGGDGTVIDAAVVGAGPFGLGVSFHLKRLGIRHRVFERGRVGQSWRSQRWDSFRINTVNAMTTMPGEPYGGPDPEGFMTRQEFVTLLDAFASRQELPIEDNCPAFGLSTDGTSEAYRLVTAHGVVLTRNVVLASGCQNSPILPKILSSSMPQSLVQVHAADYRNAARLPAGGVLVIGSAQSGIQIADDLLEAGRSVYLATSRVARLPRRHRGRDSLLWRLEAGFLDEPPDVQPDPSALFRAQAQLAAERTISLQSLASHGAVLLGRLSDVSGETFRFADDLMENVRFADETSERTRRAIDEYIAAKGIDAPIAEPDRGEVVSLQVPDPPIRSLDVIRANITSVIWCTGFVGDYSWVQLPVFGTDGGPLHDRGATACPGIYFIGLPWLSCRGSMIIAGVDRDAKRIAESVASRCQP